MRGDIELIVHLEQMLGISEFFQESPLQNEIHE